ncbi:hypothetical protein T484DRAFT_1772696 [Baffinella frigidus]|nr:hypothetical protein T484DRAFT_1772696 [Cryptophyta sp. CCMP2293]
MTDATAKLSELLSAARGRRITLRSTTNALSYLTANISSYPNDFAASLRLVRSHAACVKQLPRSDTFALSQPPQGDSFIDRGRVSSVFRQEVPREERLRCRQSLSSPRPPVRKATSERYLEPSSSIIRAKYLAPERAPSKIRVFGRTRSEEISPAPRLSSPPVRRASTGLLATRIPIYPPTARSQRHLRWVKEYVLPAGEDTLETVKTRNAEETEEEEELV